MDKLFQAPIEMPSPKKISEIIFLIDSSLGMSSFKEEIIKEYNNFIENKQNKFNDTLITTAIFNSEDYLLFNAIPTREIKKLDNFYDLNGEVCLYDSIGRTLDEVEKRLINTKHNLRPRKTAVVLFVSGPDVKSSLFNENKIISLIKSYQKDYAWDFVFWGVNKLSCRFNINMSEKTIADVFSALYSIIS